MSKVKSIMALLLICITGLFSVGCVKVYFTTGISKNILFEIEDMKAPLQEAYILLGEEKHAYTKSNYDGDWDEAIGEFTLEEYIKDLVKNNLVKISTLNLLAEDKDISLTGIEKTKIEEAAQEYFELLTEEEIESNMLSKEIVYDFYQKYFLAEKTFASLTKDYVSTVSDSDAKTILIQSIYASTDSGKVLDALNEIKAGEDFIEVANKYSEDERIEYIIRKDKTYPEFEEMAYSLLPGQVSDVVTTDNGYYVIKCISDYMIFESEAYKKELEKLAKEELFEKVYNPFANKLKHNFNKREWNKVKLDLLLAPSQARFYEIYDKYLGE